jgi:8-oxo-dGTP diphosphatase
MSKKWNCPPIAADAVVFNSNGELLLIKRSKEPFIGMYAFPGGGVDIGESVEAACCRELREETGITINQDELRLVGVYSDPARDPRHTVSVVYLVHLKTPQTPKAGDDAKAAMFVANYMDLDMAFDHKKILEDALKLRTQKIAA